MDAPFQVMGTFTCILNTVSLVQNALYWVKQGSVVFLHEAFFGSNVQRIFRWLSTNIAMIGGSGFVSNSHCRVTTWLTSTMLDGLTVNVMPAEKLTNKQITNKKNLINLNSCSLQSVFHTL